MKCVQARLTLNHVFNLQAHQLIVFIRSANPSGEKKKKSVEGHYTVKKTTSGSGRPQDVNTTVQTQEKYYKVLDFQIWKALLATDLAWFVYSHAFLL